MHAKRDTASDYRTDALGIDWIVVAANVVGVTAVVIASFTAPANQGAVADRTVIASTSE